MLKHRATFTALVAALLAAISITTAAPPAERMANTFLDHLKPGQAVSLTEKNGRYEIGIYPPTYQPLGHKVIEVGQDYVVFRDLVEITDTIVPVYSIKAIKSFVLAASNKRLMSYPCSPPLEPENESCLAAHPKRLARAQEQFKAAVTTYLDNIGARPSDFYDLELDSPAGLLRLSVYEDWVAGRFDDVARGKAFTASCGRPCNPFTGKWNFHYYNSTIESLNPDQVILDLSFYIDWLLNWESVAA